MRAQWKGIVFAMLTAVGLLFSPGQATAGHVSLALSLVIDVSGSVDASEFNLQKSGYVQAFQNTTVQNAIANLPHGIAVNFIQWSGAGQQAQSVGWTIIQGTAAEIVTESNAFAAAVNSANRAFSGLTAPGNAIQFSANTFNALYTMESGYTADRTVIDVSGDGEQNDGINTAAARNAALAGGIDTINGLSIGNAALAAWYSNNIKGGLNAFVIDVDNFNDFAAAIETKLFYEISNTVVPVPSGVYLAGIGIVCMLGYRRFSRKPLLA